jgi:transketolase
LQGHPDTLLTPGVELSTGSLGQGLSFAAGVAIAAKYQQRDVRAYCVLGDGETEEGNVWEAAMSAAKFKLDNLLAIVDWNGLQGGVTLEVMPSLEPYVDKWAAFGWHVIDIPGHDIAKLLDAYAEARATKGKPTMIVARTVKGKGVSFMENRPEWHAGLLAGEQLEQARREVNSRLEALKG